MARCCEYPRCGVTLTARGNYCPAHAPITWDHQRKQLAAHHFYRSQAWRALSRRVLQEEPVCRKCRRRPSVHADHIVDRRDGGTDDRANVQGLCQYCHSVKTATRRARGPRRSA